MKTCLLLFAFLLALVSPAPAQTDLTTWTRLTNGVVEVPASGTLTVALPIPLRKDCSVAFFAHYAATNTDWLANEPVLLQFDISYDGTNYSSVVGPEEGGVELWLYPQGTNAVRDLLMFSEERGVIGVVDTLTDRVARVGNAHSIRLRKFINPVGSVLFFTNLIYSYSNSTNY